MYRKMWDMGRTRLTKQLDEITDEDLSKRLHPDSNSVGWMLRHMAWHAGQMKLAHKYGKSSEIDSYIFNPIIC